MENVNFTIVKKVFFSLLFKNKKTTSLDVKLALREKGYFATQNEVSYYLSNIGNNEYLPFHITFNGKYKEYVLSDNLDEVAKCIIISFFKYFDVI